MGPPQTDTPGPSEVDKLRVVAYVETRRVLFSTYTNEVPQHCVESVLQIREFLTEIIGAGGIGDELLQPLRLMRRYCVRFLERVGATESRASDAKDRHLFRDPAWRMNDYWFGEALGEFRAGLGMQVAIVAASYGLDIEDDLAKVLPEPEID